MSTIGVPGLILIVLLALVLFGPKKLPELGRAVGHTLKEFKNATRSLTKDDDEEDSKESAAKQIQPASTAVQAPTANTTTAASTVQETVDREQLEKEIRERIERERLEAEVREKMNKETQHS